MTERTRHEADLGPLRVITLVNGAQRQNCHLVVERATGEALVVDPGDDGEWIVSEVKAAGVRVARLLLTHAHYDHVGAAAQVEQAFGVPCEVHVRDAPLLRRAGSYALAFEKRRLVPPRAVKTFEAEETVALGATHFQILGVPGHTPGGVAFAGPEVVLSGDTLLRNGIGRTDLPGGDASEIARSVEALLARCAPEAVLFPGHGRTWPVAEARVWWAERRAAASRGDAEEKP